MSNLSEWIKTCDELEARCNELKAEVERLDALCKQVMAQHSDISCENIMLRKAGDALHKSMLEVGPNEMAEEFDHDRWWASYYAWNAAKEGKPSA